MHVEPVVDAEIVIVVHEEDDITWTEDPLFHRVRKVGASDEPWNHRPLRALFPFCFPPTTSALALQSMYNSSDWGAQRLLPIQLAGPAAFVFHIITEFHHLPSVLVFAQVRP